MNLIQHISASISSIQTAVGSCLCKHIHVFHWMNPQSNTILLICLLSTPIYCFSYFYTQVYTYTVYMHSFIYNSNISSMLMLFWSFSLQQAWFLYVSELQFLFHVILSTKVLLSVYSHLGTVWWKHKKTRARRTSMQSAGEYSLITMVTIQLHVVLPSYYRFFY